MSPTAPLAPCRYPGCGELRASSRGAYCAGHSTADADERGTAAARGYDRRWRTLRDVVLQGEPLCRLHVDQGRMVEATEVHHIIAKRNGGTDARGKLVLRDTPIGPVKQWDGNLEPLCKPCHSAETVRGR